MFRYDSNPTMTPNPTFQHLESAYQLHFYLCLKTHYLRPIFAGEHVQHFIRAATNDVCLRHDFHLLEASISDDHLRILLSLKPEQCVSNAVRLIKGNLSRQISMAFPDRLERLRVKSPWAEGYYARSSGKVDLGAVRGYIENQVAHHGYRGTWTGALRFKNDEFHSPAFKLSHCLCMLDYHLVFATEHRAPVFDEAIAPRLFEYVTAVGRRRGFVVERVTLLPDHIHLMIEALPGVSIYDCALALVNNTALWMGKNYWGVLQQTAAWNVWQPSFYAGTVGAYSTAQVRKFLGQG
jgi:REP-associated tyrosine transposase